MISVHGTEKLFSMGFEILGLEILCVAVFTLDKKYAFLNNHGLTIAIDNIQYR